MKRLFSSLLLGSLLSILIINTAAASPYLPGANIKAPDGTIFTVTSEGTKRPYTSFGAFSSYGFNFSNSIKPANTDDLSLPTGEFIPPQDGKVICSDRGLDKGTCYLITLGKKAAFVSADVFSELGFKFKWSTAGDVSWMQSADMIFSSISAHLPGTLINKEGTIYLVGVEGLLGIPNMATFKSWGYTDNDVIPANAADKALVHYDVMKYYSPGQLSPLISASNSDKNSLMSLPEIIKQWEPKMAKIDCFYEVRKASTKKFLIKNGISTDQQEFLGSGVLIERKSSSGDPEIIIQTNRHVLNAGHNGFSDSTLCFATLPNKAEYIFSSQTDGIHYVLSGQGDDLNEITFKDGLPYKNDTIYGEIDAGYLTIHEPDQTTRDLAKTTSLCTQRPELGESILVIGYPYVGSDTGITVTEGIISGSESFYLITTAIIAPASSGGAAISVKDNCYFGIPTYNITDEDATLGRILDLNAI